MVRSFDLTNSTKLRELKIIPNFTIKSTMETIIKIHPSELDMKLLDKIRAFIGNKENIDVTISLTEFDSAYTNVLNQSLEEANKNESQISFTMEEFIAYTPEKKQ